MREYPETRGRQQLQKYSVPQVNNLPWNVWFQKWTTWGWFIRLKELINASVTHERFHPITRFKIMLRWLRKDLNRSMNDVETRVRLVKMKRVIEIADCNLARVFSHVSLACAISLPKNSFAFGTRTSEYNFKTVIIVTFAISQYFDVVFCHFSTTRTWLQLCLITLDFGLFEEGDGRSQALGDDNACAQISVPYKYCELWMALNIVLYLI